MDAKTEGFGKVIENIVTVAVFGLQDLPKETRYALAMEFAGALVGHSANLAIGAGIPLGKFLPVVEKALTDAYQRAGRVQPSVEG